MSAVKKTNLKRPRAELDQSLSARHSMRKTSTALWASGRSSQERCDESKGFGVKLGLLVCVLAHVDGRPDQSDGKRRSGSTDWPMDSGEATRLWLGLERGLDILHAKMDFRESSSPVRVRKDSLSAL